MNKITLDEDGFYGLIKTFVITNESNQVIIDSLREAIHSLRNTNQNLQDKVEVQLREIEKLRGELIELIKKGIECSSSH